VAKATSHRSRDIAIAEGEAFFVPGTTDTSSPFLIKLTPFEVVAAISSFGSGLEHVGSGAGHLESMLVAAPESHPAKT
jgi:hypothetical protein